MHLKECVLPSLLHSQFQAIVFCTCYVMVPVCCLAQGLWTINRQTQFAFNYYSIGITLVWMYFVRYSIPSYYPCLCMYFLGTTTMANYYSLCWKHCHEKGQHQLLMGMVTKHILNSHTMQSTLVLLSVISQPVFLSQLAAKAHTWSLSISYFKYWSWVN